MAKKTKIKLRSEVMPELTDWEKRMDSVKYIQDGKRECDILRRAWRCYDSLEQFREDSRRNYRYVMGDQWGDEIRVNGCRCKERDNMIARGNVPLTNNMLNRLVRTLVGVWRKQDKIPACAANDPDEQQVSDMLTLALQVVFKNNDAKEINAEGFLRYLITGWAMTKVIWDYRDGRNDVWIHNVPNFEYAFWDTNMVDSRGWDMNIIGEIHDMSFNELCRYFAHSKQDYAKLEAIYRRAQDTDNYAEFRDYLWDGTERHSTDFFFSKDKSMCRVIEVWTKERKPKYLCQDYAQEEAQELFEIDVKDKPLYDGINRQRIEQAKQWNREHPDQPIDLDNVALIEMNWEMSEYWYVRWLSPMGDVLDEMESPYEHGEHPYVLKLYPFTNGEIHSFIADLIDQQRYINRLISLNDKLLLSSAKGILLYPMSLIPEGKTPEQIEQNWGQPSAVMFYDDLANQSSGARPEQMANRLTNIGTNEMLELQMKIMEDASGVNGALQGKPGFAGQSAALYAQQTQNSSVTVLPLLESFDNGLVSKVAKKAVSLIQQCYDDHRMLLIGGHQDAVRYDPELCGNIDYDIMMYDGEDSPDARKLSKELLNTLLQIGAITPTQYVELGDWTFKQPLLRAMEKTRQAQEQQQLAMAQQAGQPADGQQVPSEINGMPVDTGTVAEHNAERILSQYEPLSAEQAQLRMNSGTSPEEGAQQ